MQINQQTFQKIKANVIDPMCRHYDFKMNEFQMQAYVEDLGGYSAEVLSMAWKEVRKECRSRPSIAHFISAIKEFSAPSSGISNPVDRNEHVCKRDSALAHNVMQSDIGRYAIQKGVGHSAWLYAFDKGRTITKAEVDKEATALRNSADKLARLQADRNPMANILTAFWETIKQREEDLRRRYGS